MRRRLERLQEGSRSQLDPNLAQLGPILDGPRAFLTCVLRWFFNIAALYIKTPKIAPRAPQEAPRPPPRGPMTLQDRLKISQDHPKAAQDHPRTLQDLPKIAPRPPKIAPRPPKTTPRPPQDRPRSPQRRPRDSQEHYSQACPDQHKGKALGSEQLRSSAT